MPLSKNPTWGEVVRLLQDTERREYGTHKYDVEQLCRFILNTMSRHRDRLFRGKRGAVYEKMIETLTERFGHDLVDRTLTNELFWETSIVHANTIKSQ